MNGDITLAALRQCQRTSKVMSPFIIFAVLKTAKIMNGDITLEVR